MKKWKGALLVPPFTCPTQDCWTKPGSKIRNSSVILISETHPIKLPFIKPKASDLNKMQCSRYRAAVSQIKAFVQTRGPGLHWTFSLSWGRLIPIFKRGSNREDKPHAGQDPDHGATSSPHPSSQTSFTLYIPNNLAVYPSSNLWALV